MSSDLPENGGRERPVDNLDTSASSVKLRVNDEALTPLPRLDQALHQLRPLGALVRGPRGRYRAAIVHALGRDGAGRWKIREIHHLVHWMEPRSVTQLVQELTDADLLRRDPVEATYRLAPNVRVLVTLLDALAVEDVPARRMVRLIGQAMSLAVATGAGDEALLSQFEMAMAALEFGEREMVQLLDDFSPDALLEAGQAVKENVADMEALLREHADLFGRRREDKLLFDLEARALELVARVGRRSAQVVELNNRRAETHLQFAGRIDRTDLVELIGLLGEEQLADMIRDLVSLPTAVPSVDAFAAMTALEMAVDREAPEPAALPPAASTPRRRPEPESDPLDVVIDQLQRLAEPTRVAAVVAKVDYGWAFARHIDIASVYSRSTAGLPKAQLSDEVEPVDAAGVARMSASVLIPGPENAA